MSNLIKSSYYVPLESIKQIEAPALKFTPLQHPAGDDAQDGSSQALDPELAAIELQKEQMLQEAKQEAELIVKSAQEVAQRQQEEARAEISSWWEEERAKDLERQEEARQSGYEQGYSEGQQAGEQHIREQYESLIKEGRSVLEQAHEAARHTLAGSEPFLIALSCKIAERIIGRQLELSQDWTQGIIQEALKRSIDKGTITLCVSPGQYAYVQSVRDELSNMIDAQAELQILPDTSVKDHGCVVKTSFGSIDARVDTQLTEIKDALLDLCRRGEQASAE